MMETMNGSIFQRRLRRAPLLLAALAGLLARTCGAGPLPESDRILDALLERSRITAEAAQPQYSHAKRVLLEKLDESGKPRQSEERFYRVEIIGGMTFPQLTGITGRDLSPEELAAENEREEEFRRKMTGIDLREKLRKRESWLTRDLMDRFDWTVTGREMRDQRPVLVLTFQPRSPLPRSAGPQDRLINRMHGTLLVDEEDAEIVRAEVVMDTPVSMGWLGILGSIHHFTMDVVRIRSREGIWLNQSLDLSLMGRKLLFPMRFRVQETSSDFQRVEQP